MFALTLAHSARAASFVWTGGTDGNWNTAGNWDAGVPAGAVDTALLFDNAIQPTMVNNIPGGLTLNALTFGAGSSARTLTGNAITFDGASPALVNLSTDPNDVRISTPLVLNQTLNITGGPTFDAQLLFSTGGGFSGPGGIHWSGGVGLNNAASTFAGAVLVSGGAFGTNLSTGMGNAPSVTVTSGGSFQLQGGANLNKPLSIAGAGFGSNAALNASNGGGTWSGAITLADDARVNAFNNGTLTLSGGVALAGNDLTVAPTNGTVAFTSVIGGTGHVTKSGAGTMRLHVTPTFAGNLEVQAGTLQLAAANVLPGNFPVNIASGATMDTGGFSHTTDAGALTGTGDIRLSLGQTFTVDNPVDRTLTTRFTGVSGSTTGVFVLQKSGAGTLTLAGAPSAYTGSTRVSAGTLRLGADEQVSEIPASTSAFAPGCFFEVAPGATFDLNGFDETVGALQGGGSIVIPAGSVLTSSITHPFQVSPTFQGLMSGAGTFRFASAGQSLTFTQNQLHTGGTVIVSGGIAASEDGRLGAAGTPLTLTNGTLAYTAPFTLDPARPIVADGTIGGVLMNGFATTIGSNITGPGRFNKFGTGTLTLTGINTQADGIRVAEGTLEVVSAAQTGSGGVFDFGFQSGFTVTPATLRALGSFTIPATRSTAFVSWTVDTNGFDVTFDQPLNGTHLTKEGAGVLRINGANATSETGHLVQVSGGTLRLGVNDALSTGIQISVAAGASLDLNGFNQTARFVNADGPVLLGAGTLTVRTGGFFNAPISGPGALIVDGNGTLLNAANSFSGGLTVKNGGSVLAADPASFGAPGNPIVLDNGGLGASSLAPAPIVIDGTANLTITAAGARFSAEGQSLVIAAPLSGSSPLRFSGGSGPGEEPKYEVRLTHAANSFVGDVILGNSQIGFDATLGIVADGSLGAAGNVVRLGDRFFDGESTRTNRGTLRAFADLTLPATRGIVLRGGESRAALDTNGFDVTIEGAVAESFAGSGLVKTGEGTLFLDGVNTYTGETRVDQGALGGSGAIGDLRVTGTGSLAPGHGVGLLQTGSVQFEAGAMLALEFGSAISADQLSVAGTVTLSGDVELELGLGYAPAGSDTFVVLLNDGVELIDTGGGSFAVGGDPLGEGEVFNAAGATWSISYAGGSGNDVTLTVVPEPGVGVLLLLAGMRMMARRRRP